DAAKFLGDVITSDIARVDPSRAAYGGLLSPQGKVFFDLLILSEGDRYLFDLPRALVPELLKRLTFYRLRAKVELGNLSNEFSGFAAWDRNAPAQIAGVAAVDPRLAALGYRGIGPKGAADPGFATASE